MIGYVNIYHLAWAIEQAKSTDPKKIAEKIRTGKYENPLFVYPLSYTEYGDLKEGRLAIVAFKSGGTELYPGENWHVETVYISPPLPPVESST